MQLSNQASSVDRQVDWFLSDQRAAGVVVKFSDYLKVAPREKVSIATVLVKNLGPVTGPDSEGARFRTALYQVMQQAADAKTHLILDLSQVTNLNTESAFTLADANQFMKSRGLKLVLLGAAPEVERKLVASRGAFGVSRQPIANAATLADAMQLAS